MRNIIAISLGLGLLVVAACGNSNTTESSCTDVGGVCIKTGSACGDTLPYECPSSGVCCSPTNTGTPTSEAPSQEPVVR